MAIINAFPFMLYSHAICTHSKHFSRNCIRAKRKKIIAPRPLSDTTQSLFVFLSNPRLGATKLNALLNRRANTSSMRENNFQREESIVIFDSPLLGTNLIHEQYFMGGKSIVPSTGILPETLRRMVDVGGRYWSYCRLDNNVLLS